MDATNWVGIYMVVGGLAATILMEISYLPLGDWSGSFAGLLVAVAIVVAIFGGVSLLIAQVAIGIAREW
jgi:hypothetical protein